MINSAKSFFRIQDWVLGFLLFAFTLAAYYPAWNGQPVWDDEKHMTRPELQSVAGLVYIWTKPSMTAQYYPLVHSLFWVEHRIFGDSIPGPALTPKRIF